MGEATVTTSEYLEVVVATAYDDEKTFNIDKPKSTLTLAQVRSAFEDLTGANDSDCVVFCDKNGEAYTQFKYASRVQTTKRVTPLE